MSEGKKEGNTLSGIQIFLGIFVVTYFLWYMGGGPEKWERKYETIGKQEIKENIAGKGIFLIDEKR